MYAQVYTQTFKQGIKQLKKYNLTYLDTSSFNNISESEKKFFLFQSKLIKTGKIDSLLIVNKKKNKRNLIIQLILEGDFQLFKNHNDSLAFNLYNQGLNNALAIKDTVFINESIKKIVAQLYKNRKSKNTLLSYLDILKNYLYDLNEKTYYNYYYYTIQANITRKENVTILKQKLQEADSLDNDYLKAKFHQMIALQYQYFLTKLDSSLYHNQKALTFINKKDYNYFRNELFGINMNIAILYQLQKNYIKSNDYLTRASNVKIPRYRYLEKIKLNNLFSKNYSHLNNYKSAYYYQNLSKKYADSLNEYNKAIAFNDINTKYQTEKKEKENIELKAKRKQDKLILLIGAIFVLFGGIVTYLNLKNSKRKRLLAEQQKELEKQKNLTLLKEQEINTINAMIDGQEKERVRIAEDLHDNIGSVLATLKLHFENLKLNREKEHFNQEELYSKTEKLIDETYLKVRSIAHAKNAGVIANKGLLIAIKLMAEKISDANRITIEVLDFGLDKRLENSLEIAVFRIVQELTTNIIKHADATHATINISQFDNNLNIIIEDNGRGFNMNTIELKNGMGLNSIQTRIEHLKGTFEVDSTIGKGTSIIIDIPIINT